MRSALKDVEGVGNIEIKVGDKDFTVHFDSKKTKAETIVDCLKKGGEEGAKIKKS